MDTDASKKHSRAKPRSSVLRKFLFHRRAVGLDISGGAAIVVEVKRRRKNLRILRSGSAPIACTGSADPHAATVAAIKQALANAGIRARKVVVNLPGEPTECNVKSLPVMPVDEIEAIIRREGINLYGPNTAWDYIFLPQQSSQEFRVLCAYAPGERVSECLHMLKACGIAASAVCVSHLSLLQIMNLPADAAESAALVHFGRQAVSVVVLAAGSPALIRRIQLDDKTDGSPDYMVPEINRTLLYFKQQCRGKRVTRVIQSGAPAAVCEALSREAGVSMEDFASWLVGISEGEARRPAGKADEQDSQGCAADISVAAGLAMVGTRVAEIDLLPDEVKERRTRGMKAATLLMGAAASIAIYAACYIALATAEAIYRSALERQRAQVKVFEPVLQSHSEILDVKRKLQQKQDLAAALMKENLSWPHLLWGIGKTIPPEASVNLIAAVRERTGRKPVWKLRLSGKLSVEGDQRARVLRQLVESLQKCGFFAGVQLDPFSEEASGKVMDFSIQCEVLPQGKWVI